MTIPDDRRLAALLKKQEQLAAQIKAAEARVSTKERKLRTRRLILLGTFLESRLAEDDVLRRYVRQHLPAHLTTPRDRSLFAALLAHEPQADPSTPLEFRDTFA